MLPFYQPENSILKLEVRVNKKNSGNLIGRSGSFKIVFRQQDALQILWLQTVSICEF